MNVKLLAILVLAGLALHFGSPLTGGDKKKDGPKVPDGLKALQHPDAMVRYKAAVTLGQLGPTAKFAIPELRKALKDPNALVRVKVCEALWKIEQPLPSIIMPVLLEAMQSKDPGVRAAAPPVLALIGSKAKAAIPVLIDALKDKELDVKLAAVAALGDFGPIAKDAVEPLIALAEDKDFFLLEPFVGAALGSLGDSVAPTLAQALSSRSPERRRVAAYALSTLGAGALPALDELTRALTYNDAAVRSLAARAIGRIGPKANAALPKLEASLADMEVSVRIAVAHATFLVSGEAKHVGVLVEALGDPSVGARDAACQTLGLMKAGAKEAVEPVVKLLDDEALRIRAIMTLGEIGPAAQKAAPLLKKAFADKDGEVQLRAAYAHWQITGQTKETLKILEEMLASEKYDHQAIALLAEMGPAARDSVPTLVAVYREEEVPAFRLAVGKALKKIDPETAKKLGIR